VEPSTIPQVLQFYAPFAGLLCVVFWLGVLSQRVKNLEAAVKKLENLEESDGDIRKLVTLEVQMGNVLERLASVDRSLSGVQRQLGNLASRPPPQEFTPHS
jgi:hypothetical protein